MALQHRSYYGDVSVSPLLRILQDALMHAHDVDVSWEDLPHILHTGCERLNVLDGMVKIVKVTKRGDANQRTRWKKDGQALAS